MKHINKFVKDVEINGEAGDLAVNYSVVWEDMSYDAYNASGSLYEVSEGRILREIVIHDATHYTDYGTEVPVKDLSSLYDNDSLIDALENHALELEVM